MDSPDARTLPLDPVSTASLADAGLEYRRVDPDGAEFPNFVQAVDRGFLGQESTDEQIGSSRDGLSYRRMTGIYDRASAQPDTPVATVDSWVAELTIEPGAVVPMWAISAVTVAPTHRRRGIARAMIEGELRTAADAGVAIAGLTVSEATIYGRFGFSPAVYVTDWTIETARARWIGPRPGGRVDAIDRETLRDVLATLHDRIRLTRPGQVDGWPGLWRRTAGLAPGQEGGRRIRAVQYRDDAGEVRGAVAFTLSEEGEDYSKHTLTVTTLLAENGDAYAALWRFVLEHDLVSIVKADLRSTDEPLRWMIADQRAAIIRESDHHWLRILDVPAVLTARTYRTRLSSTLRITDPLGFADGRWQLQIGADGVATVTPVEDSTAPDVVMDAGSLASILLGGVSASTLGAAGRIVGDAASLAAVDAAFAPTATPQLTLWY